MKENKRESEGIEGKENERRIEERKRKNERE